MEFKQEPVRIDYEAIESLVQDYIRRGISLTPFMETMHRRAKALRAELDAQLAEQGATPPASKEK